MSYDPPVILNKIISELEKQSMYPDHDVPHLFTSGEYDSNQTKFELACNRLEIAVVSRSKKVGMVLLAILRGIIDDNFDGVMQMVDSRVSEKRGIDPFTETEGPLFGVSGPVVKKFIRKDKLSNPPTISETIEALAELETGYLATCPINETMTVTLSGYEIDQKTGEWGDKIVDTVITKTSDQIDLWTLPRIKQWIEDNVDADPEPDQDEHASKK